MRKTIVTLLMIIAVMVVAGCGESTSINYETYSDYTETVNDYSAETETNDYFELQDPDGYRVTVSGDVRFVPTGKEVVYTNFDDLYMYTFVDLETGNMYLYTEKRVGASNAGRGLGTTFTPLINADGTPCIYEDLESLREFYGYKIN